MDIEKSYILFVGLIFSLVIMFFFLWGLRRYRKNIHLLLKGKVMSSIFPEKAFFYYKYKAFSTAVICFLIGLALARPMWGFELRSYQNKGNSIIFALDVSKSMRADDVLPSRLAVARSAIKDIVKEIEFDRVALITFSGEAFVVCPFTEDIDSFIRILDNVKIETVNKGGTAFLPVVIEAKRAFEWTETESRDVFIVGDGESTVTDALKAARIAKKNNIRLFSIGVGTVAGALIHVGEPVKEVRVKLDIETLQELANKTKGYFYSNVISHEKILQINKDLFKGEKKKKYEVKQIRTERFQIPLCLVILLLFVELFIQRENYE